MTKINIDEVSGTKKNGFIVIEGVNGAGKSTIITKVQEHLSLNNIPAIFTREPGSGELGVIIRDIVLNSPEKIPELTELFLFAADRSQHVEKIIKPAIAENKLVISDRYYYSTIAFQSYGRGLNYDLVQQINQLAIQNTTPDLVILLDLEPDIGLQRNQVDPDKTVDNFECTELEFHQRIRQGFLKIAETLPENFIIIDANRSPEEVQQEVIKAIDCYVSGS